MDACSAKTLFGRPFAADWQHQQSGRSPQFRSPESREAIENITLQVIALPACEFDRLQTISRSSGRLRGHAAISASSLLHQYAERPVIADDVMEIHHEYMMAWRQHKQMATEKISARKIEAPPGFC